MRKLGLLLLFLCASVISGEALWPLHSLPLEEIEKDWGFKPNEKWIERVQRATARVIMKGAPGGGSGAFVSPEGLLITNRHVVVDILGGLSTAQRNLVRDGFCARTRVEEIDSGMEICVLQKTVNVTEKVRAELGPNPTSADISRYTRQVQNSMREPGLSIRLVPLLSGAEYWVYVYEVYPAKLVFVPDEALGAFGGEEDNFCYPRHKLDVAFLRAYQDGRPLQSAYFSLAPQGPAEGDYVFVAGNPGMTERYLPLSRIEYLRDSEFPLEVATGRPIVAAIEKYMGQGVEQRKNANASLEHYANALKLKSGALQFFKRPDFLAARKKQEQEWRETIAASPEATKLAGDAFEQVANACAVLSKSAATRHFCEMPQGRLWGLVRSLNSFSEAIRGKPDAVLSRMVTSFGEFVDKVIDPNAPILIDVERGILSAWLLAAQESLPGGHAFLKLALNGQAPEDAARALLAGAERLTKTDAVKELIGRGATGIEAAKLPVLKFVSALAGLGGGETAEAAAAEERYRTSIGMLERALAAAYGKKIAPNATGTLRLGWGVLRGYEEDGRKIPCMTTFESMLARSAAQPGKPAFALSKSFLAAQLNLDLKTHLNFVSTADGCPGSSGSPMFTKDFHLVGVMFDGNQQEVPSIYSYIQPETGGRSISVDCAAVLAALERVYKASALLVELNTAAEGAAKATNKQP